MPRTPNSRRQIGRRLAKAAPATALALASSAIAVGVSSASDRSPEAALASPPATVAATELPASSRPPNFKPVGTVVRSSSVGIRVFINASNGIALNTGASLNGVTYPVATVNGGKTWRIDGPELHIPAANAPNVVTQVGAASPAMYFVYGGPGGGQSVNVSTNAGKRWWRAYLGGVVYAVVPFNTGARTQKLIAFTNLPGAYYSTDGGKTWHYTTSASSIA
jgi:BNR/Asp-box repeat